MWGGWERGLEAPLLVPSEPAPCDLGVPGGPEPAGVSGALPSRAIVVGLPVWLERSSWVQAAVSSVSGGGWTGGWVGCWQL